MAHCTNEDMLDDPEPLSSIFPYIDSHTHIIYEKKHKYADFIGDRYLKGSLIGEGSYSKVKDTLDAQSLTRKAAKIVSRKKIRKIPNGEINVRREVMILKKLSHTNVIKLFHSFQDLIKDKLYLILEYCLGDLQTLLDNSIMKCFCLWQAKYYFVQLIDGLEYIHSRGIVHKDIKPGNMLISADDILKLTDFGVAEELSPFQNNDECKFAQGAPAFQSPEEVTGLHDSWSGFKADIWSAGVSLYNFTTGQYPFEGDCLYQIISSIQNDIVVVPNILPCSLIDLLANMLQKIPDNRLSIYSIKSHSWVLEIISPPPEDQILRFGCYNKAANSHRGLTVTPYLESLHNYTDGNDKRQDLFCLQGYNRNFEIENDFDQNSHRSCFPYVNTLINTHSVVGGSEQQISNFGESADHLESLNLDLDHLRLANSVEVIDNTAKGHGVKDSVLYQRNSKTKHISQSCKQQ
ncbi:hypothetical protein LOD99_5356 [Oopsacas minuta]|uniref:non-specific serine/threonine protein kinase n=1 Tax=Oopsacas minuta TaxID=111878 RepID=A0AAV7JQR8_9METZ|nr:hypothetical protein LOD99_5356 [Oopsacas minuta]